VKLLTISTLELSLCSPLPQTKEFLRQRVETRS
jgi:hypothetical protein